jgi:hypothetical protein
MGTTDPIRVLTTLVAKPENSVSAPVGFKPGPLFPVMLQPCIQLRGLSVILIELEFQEVDQNV